MNFFIQTICKVFKIPALPSCGINGQTQIFKSSPAYFHYKVWKFFLTKIPGIFITIVFFLPGVVLGILGERQHSEASFLAILMIIAGLIIFTTLFLILITIISYKLDYEMRRYILDEKSIRIREGIFNVREMTLTISKIQNISVTQGPLQKFFNIADIELQTAGGRINRQNTKEQKETNNTFDYHKAVIKGLSNYNEIKSLLMDILKQYKDSGIVGVPITANLLEKSGRKINPEKLKMLCEIRREFEQIAKFAEGGKLIEIFRK